MNIIVTGADGFIGTNLINKLCETTHNLMLIGKDVSKMKASVLKDYGCYSYVEISQDEMGKAFENFEPDVLIHLAAYSTASDAYEDMEKLIEANLLYLCKILDALKCSKIKSFIYTGSFAEFFNGDNVFDPAYLYAATKTAGRSIATYYANTYNFKLISICPYTVYGGIDNSKKIIDYLFDSLDNPHPIDISSGAQILDFIHVNDIALLLIKIAENIDIIPSGAIFKAGTGEGHTFKDIIRIMEEETGLKSNLNLGGRPYRKRDIMHAVADTNLQKKLLNFTHKISLRDGIKGYLKEKSKNK